jgi:hypothetical protein
MNLMQQPPSLRSYGGPREPAERAEMRFTELRFLCSVRFKSNNLKP